MVALRLIPCLDVANGRVVKGVNFVNLRDSGDPVELACKYSDEGKAERHFSSAIKRFSVWSDNFENQYDNSKKQNIPPQQFVSWITLFSNFE